MARGDERPKLLVIFGTRPEAIKLMPIISALRAWDTINLRICSTGQHCEMLSAVLALWQHIPDINLRPIQEHLSTGELAVRLIAELGRTIADEHPDRILVQGDTCSAFAGALGGHLQHVPIAHLEAGLRTGNLDHPWPEEGHRRMIGQIADLHFAPTSLAARALARAGVRKNQIHLTGNSGIDALFSVYAQVKSCPQTQASVDALLAGTGGRRIILVTAHRRENLGAPMQRIATALSKIAARDDCCIIAPLHPNPEVRSAMAPLIGLPGIRLIEPLNYATFVALLARCYFVLTDSGGIQEEAPALGKPVLIMRDTTERPEGIKAGTSRLVGTHVAGIVDEVTRLLEDPADYHRMSRAHCPYGDGLASQRVAAILDANMRPQS